MKLGLADTHCHSEYSHDSTANFDEVIQGAIEKGLSSITITDHCDIELNHEVEIPKSVASYVRAQRAKKKYADRIKVFSGLEIGFAEGFEEYGKELETLCANVDEVIYSVHCLPYRGKMTAFSSMDFTTFTQKQIDEFLMFYFETVRKSLDMRADILPHLTCPYRYIKYKCGKSINESLYEPIIKEILDIAIERNIALEINTSGTVSGVGMQPDEWIIKCYLDRGGKMITLGADAHIPQNIGAGFDKAVELLKKLGISSVYRFEKRKPIEIKI